MIVLDAAEDEGIEEDNVSLKVLVVNIFMYILSTVKHLTGSRFTTTFCFMVGVNRESVAITLCFTVHHNREAVMNNLLHGSS